MHLHCKILTTSLLVATGVTIARGQEAPAVRNLALINGAAEDGRIQQFVQMLQPSMWRELDFVRQVCNLTPEQRPKIKAAADTATKEAAKALVKPQQARAGMMAQSQQIQGARLIREAIQAELKKTLTSEQLERYEAEETSRQQATKQASVQGVVSQLDAALFLSREQRETISAALNANWQPEWEHWLSMYQYAGTYLPQVPDQHVVPHLNAEQKTVWSGLQKVMINSWHNNGRRQVDDGWWTGKVDNSPKGKAPKAKGPVGKAATGD